MKSLKKTKAKIKHSVKEKGEIKEKIALTEKEIEKTPVEITEVPQEEEKKKEQVKAEVATVKVEERSSLIMRIVVPAIIGAVVGVFTAGSVLMYVGKLGQDSKVVEPTPTITIAPSPLESVLPGKEKVLSEDLSLYDIKVLNGSGKAGVAGNLEKLLKDEGYSVLEIGNAGNSDYKETVIQAKENVPEEYIDKLKILLEKTYLLADLEELETENETDVVIIVGQNQIEPTGTEKEKEE